MTAACPHCRKPVDAAYRPFCSKRCADVDLNRWLTGAYVIPGSKHAEGDGEPDEDQDPDQDEWSDA
jgi:endogenous inhibitor of DNA gyrase (YacG/DUF329 family)